MIKLSNGVEISEQTIVNALKKAGIDVKPKKTDGQMYPIATVYSDRLILNLPDKYLSDKYKGYVFSVSDSGVEGQRRKKTDTIQLTYNGHWYSETEKQVFP